MLCPSGLRAVEVLVGEAAVIERGADQIEVPDELAEDERAVPFFAEPFDRFHQQPQLGRTLTP
jgi:hypothetical protein